MGAGVKRVMYGVKFKDRNWAFLICFQAGHTVRCRWCVSRSLCQHEKRLRQISQIQRYLTQPFSVGFRHCRLSDGGLPVPQWDAFNSRQAVGSPPLHPAEEQNN